MTMRDKLFRKVDLFHGITDEDCWNWTGWKHRSGHGYVGSGTSGRNVQCHRVSWKLFKGVIPKGLCVLHKCDNPACVNPSHLFLGTQQDNMRDMNTKDRHAKGERCNLDGLTESDAKKALRLKGKVSHTELGKRFGVNRATISYLLEGKTWKHLQPS